MKKYGRILMKHAIIVPINEVRAVVIYKLLNLAVPYSAESFSGAYLIYCKTKHSLPLTTIAAVYLVDAMRGVSKVWQ